MINLNPNAQEEREKLEKIWRKNGLPVGVELRKFTVADQKSVYVAVFADTGRAYSALPRDEYGKVLTTKPKYGFQREWQKYRLSAIASAKPYGRT